MKFCLIVFATLIMACSKKNISTIDKHYSQEFLVQAFTYKNLLLVNNDSVMLKKVIHPSVDFSHSNCWSEDFLSITNKDNSLLDYKNIDIKEQTFKVVDNIGIVRGKGDYTIKYKGNDMIISLCFIETYIFSNRKWLLLTRPSSKIQ
jgi:hypothetical protein